MYLHGVLLLKFDVDKGNTAIELALELKQKIKDFMRMPKAERALNKTDFKDAFLEQLHSKDDIMTIHRARWKTIMANILVALTGIGLLAIGANYFISRRCFFVQTTREKQLAAVQNQVVLRF